MQTLMRPGGRKVQLCQTRWAWLAAVPSRTPALWLVAATATMLGCAVATVPPLAPSVVAQVPSEPTLSAMALPSGGCGLKEPRCDSPRGEPLVLPQVLAGIAGSESVDEAEEAEEAEDDAAAVEADAADADARRRDFAASLGERHPLDGLDGKAIHQLVRGDLPKLGSMSFGPETAGGLLNGVRMTESDRWMLADPEHAWGTQETVDYIGRAIDAVYRQYPQSPRLYIGDLSAERGGNLRPHSSHQSGRDVDLGFYYLGKNRWYQRATAGNLDRARTWSLMRGLITETDVQFIFLDRRVQDLLRGYALKLGEDPEWLKSVFDGKPGEPAIVRHEPGHATHMHVRFYNPVATETARRCYQALRDVGRLPASPGAIRHKVRPGETLARIAERYGTTIGAIQRANGLKGSTIRANRSYRIPTAGVAPPPPEALSNAPGRRLPPPRAAAGRVARR